MSQTFNQPQANSQWHVDKINAAIKEADAGDFATDEVVRAL